MRKIGCERCQALLAKGHKRCRNLAQCRVKSAVVNVSLCNVHEEYVRKHGVESLQYDTNLMKDNIKPSLSHTLSESHDELHEKLDSIAREQSTQRNLIDSIALKLQTASIETIDQKWKQYMQNQKPSEQDLKFRKTKDRKTKDRVTEDRRNQSTNKSAFRDEIVNDLVDSIEGLMRATHAEIGSLRSISQSLCKNVTEREIEQELEPLTNLLQQIDALATATRDVVVQNYAQSANVGSFLEDQAKEKSKLETQLADQSESVRNALAKKCKTKKFVALPSVRFTLNLLNGKAKCNDQSVSPAIRNWYATGVAGENGDEQWTERQLLCQLDNTKSSAKSERALEKDQELRNRYSVYDVDGNVVGIGKRTKKEKEDNEKDDSVLASFQKAAVGALALATLLKQYVRLLDSLNLLLALYAVVGRDTRGLATERQFLQKSIVNLSLKVGPSYAADLLGADRYSRLMLETTLVTSYAAHLETDEGAAELATLAAFSATETARANGASDSEQRAVARQSYAHALRALLLLGAAGSLSQYMWLKFAVAPRTSPSIVASLPRTVPSADNPTTYAPALPLPPHSGDQNVSQNSLPFVFREITKANLVQRLEKNMNQLALQTERDFAAVRSLRPGDAEKIKLAALFPASRSFGASRFPLTRAQWRAEQLNSTFALLSPASQQIERLYDQLLLQRREKTTTAVVDIVSQTRLNLLSQAASLNQLGQTKLNETRLLEPLGGPMQTQQRASAVSDVPIPLFLPADSSLYSAIGNSGPMSLLPGFEQNAGLLAASSSQNAGLLGANSSQNAGLLGASSNQNALVGASSAMGQLAQNAELLSVLAQIWGPAPPVHVTIEPAVQRLIKRASLAASSRSSDAASNKIRNSTDLLHDYNSGLRALAEYSTKRYAPSAAARKSDPQSAAALASAASAALSDLESNESDFFDEMRAPSLESAAERLSQNDNVFCAQQRPLNFLQHCSGAFGTSALTAGHINQLYEQSDAITSGLTNNTALDMHLQRSFEIFRAQGAAAREIGIDAEMLVAAADGNTGSFATPLDQFHLHGGSMSAERRAMAESAVDAAALVAERDFGGGRQVQDTAQIVLAARGVAELALTNAAAMQGLVTGLIEKAFEKNLLAVQRANDFCFSLASLIVKVGNVAIDEAALVAERAADQLALVGQDVLATLKTREQIDEALFSTLSKDLSSALTEQQVRYIVDASLDGIATVSDITSATSVAIAEIGSAIAVHGKTAAEHSAVLADQLTLVLSSAAENVEDVARSAGVLLQNTFDTIAPVVREQAQQAGERAATLARNTGQSALQIARSAGASAAEIGARLGADAQQIAALAAQSAKDAAESAGASAEVALRAASVSAQQAVEQLGKSAAEAAEIAARVTNEQAAIAYKAAQETGAEWGEYGIEQARAAMRVLGRAGKKTLDETAIVLEQVQREAPQVWRNEVLPRLQRAEAVYKAQINFLARNYMPAADASSAERVQAALDMRERGTQAFAELEQRELTLLEDVRSRLQHRNQSSIVDQRQALIDTAATRTRQRAQLQHEMQEARQQYAIKLANASILAPPNTSLKIPARFSKSVSTRAQEQIAVSALEQSMHYAEWEAELRNAPRAKRDREQRAKKLFAASKKAANPIRADQSPVEPVAFVESVSQLAPKVVEQDLIQKWDGSELAKLESAYKLFECLLDSEFSKNWILRQIEFTAVKRRRKQTTREVEKCGRQLRLDPQLIEQFKFEYGDGSYERRRQKSDLEVIYGGAQSLYNWAFDAPNNQDVQKGSQAGIQESKMLNTNAKL